MSTNFKLSARSRRNLVGVKPQLVAVVERAILISAVDFAVTEGVRTIETQRQYFDAGKSQTMRSKHLTGDAVDLVAFVGGAISWELDLYDEIAEAMAISARELGVGLLWGAAWTVPDITKWENTLEAAMNSYIDARRRAGRRPFIDAPHFELVA